MMPTISLSWISQELAFPSEADCLSYLSEHGAVLSQEKGEVDCKASLSGFIQWERAEEEKHKLEGQ